MNNQSTPFPKEGPRKPRALTYTEMMNGGRQQMDEAEHNREVELQRRWWCHWQPMTDPKRDIDRLQQEMDQARTDAAKAGKGEVVKAPKNQSLDAVVTGAGMLLVLGLAVGFASRLTLKQVKSLTAGSVGASAGLVVGYFVGRRRNG
tara:strand:- start:683 stop:1123 length:441 start_codon:yes stop_codon:yes gene_type:complete